MADDKVVPHITSVTSALALGAEVYMSPELEKKIMGLPEGIRDTFKNQAFKATWFKKAADQATPLDYLKERIGPYDSDIGDNKKLEYFPDDYVITELDRLYPGWWMEDMKGEYINTLRTYIVTGYLCIEYPTFEGMKISKRWASAGQEIEFKTDDSGQPSNPSGAVIGGRTYWIRSAGKLYGIGLDIYHQRVTPELKSMFEDRVRNWGVYATEAKQIIATIETGQGFRNYLREMPTVTQTNRILVALSNIPADMESGDGNLHDLIWKNFTKLKMDTRANRQQAEQFIVKVEATAIQVKQKKENEDG